MTVVNDAAESLYTMSNTSLICIGYCHRDTGKFSQKCIVLEQNAQNVLVYHKRTALNGSSFVIFWGMEQYKLFKVIVPLHPFFLNINRRLIMAIVSCQIPYIVFLGEFHSQIVKYFLQCFSIYFCFIQRQYLWVLKDVTGSDYKDLSKKNCSK